MMYKVIEDEKEISRHQEEFKEILRNGTEVFENQPHGDVDGNIKVDKYWSSKFEFWYAYVSLEKRKNTHINLFGLTRPTGKSCSATVEINFPVKGIYRKLQGIFAEDDKDKVIVVHRGKFQRNLEEGGRSSPKNYNGERIDIQDGDRKTNVILVGELHSSDFLEGLSNFIKEVNKIKKEEVSNDEINDNDKQQNIQQKNKVNTTNVGTIKKSMNSKTDETIQKKEEETSYLIAQRIREIILKINEICRLHNKRHIFDQAALFELWDDIENSCKSKNDFKNFTGNLYKLLREKTRYDNPNKKTKDDPKYVFLLPKNFIKIDTPTRHFWDIVNTLRHYYIHDEIGKIADVYEELLGKNKKSGPETPEDYMKLQIEVLKQFEDSMEKLLEMVKDDLNRPKTH